MNFWSEERPDHFVVLPPEPVGQPLTDWLEDLLPAQWPRLSQEQLLARRRVLSPAFAARERRESRLWHRALRWLFNVNVILFAGAGVLLWLAVNAMWQR